MSRPSSRSARRVPLLVALNGFFVAAEFALVTVRWTRVEELVEEGKFGALAVREAVEKLDDAIAATQLGITFASLALGWIGEPALAHLIEPLFRALPGAWSVGGHARRRGRHRVPHHHLPARRARRAGAQGDRARSAPRTWRCVVAGPLLVFGRVFRPFISS